MRMAPRATAAALIAVAIGVPSALAAADGTAPTTAPTPAGSFEKHFVKAASAGNLFEIRAGQIAERAGSAQTCQVGMMLVTDHAAAQAKLTATAAAIGAPLKLTVTPLQGWLLRRLARDGAAKGGGSSSTDAGMGAGTSTGMSTGGTVTGGGSSTAVTGGCADGQGSNGSGRSQHRGNCDKQHEHGGKSGDSAGAHVRSASWTRDHCDKGQRDDENGTSSKGGTSGRTNGPSSFDWTFLTLMGAAHRQDIAEYSEAAQLTDNAAVRQYACEQLPILIKHLAAIQAAMTTIGVRDDSAAASAAAGDDSASDPAPTAPPAVCAA